MSRLSTRAPISIAGWLVNTCQFPALGTAHTLRTSILPSMTPSLVTTWRTQNNMFNIVGITDPGPGNRDYIGFSTGVCTVIQQPSSEDSNAVYQCYTSSQFQSGSMRRVRFSSPVSFKDRRFSTLLAFLKSEILAAHRMVRIELEGYK
jgi:hypothetical protein